MEYVEHINGIALVYCKGIPKLLKTFMHGDSKRMMSDLTLLRNHIWRDKYIEREIIELYHEDMRVDAKEYFSGLVSFESSFPGTRLAYNVIMRAGSEVQRELLLNETARYARIINALITGNFDIEPSAIDALNRQEIDVTWGGANVTKNDWTLEDLRAGKLTIEQRRLTIHNILARTLWK